MSWDATTPANGDAASLGDDIIREFKTDMATALSEEGIFPGADPTNPVFKWTGKRGDTASRPASPETGEIYFNTQLFQMEYYDGASWTAYDLVPLLGITTAKINDLAVTEEKLGALSVTAAKLAADAVTNTKIADNAVTSAKILANSIDTVKIDPLAVTEEKIADSAVRLTSKVVGTLPVANGGTGLTAKMISFVTFTGNGAGRSIAHGLGQTPDLVLIIRTDTAASNSPGLWVAELGVYTRFTSGGLLSNEITGADATNVTLGSSSLVNLSGAPYAMFTFKAQ